MRPRRQPQHLLALVGVIYLGTLRAHTLPLRSTFLATRSFVCMGSSATNVELFDVAPCVNQFEGKLRGEEEAWAAAQADGRRQAAAAQLRALVDEAAAQEAALTGAQDANRQMEGRIQDARQSHAQARALPRPKPKAPSPLARP